MTKTDTERLDFMDRHGVRFSNNSTARVDIDAAMNRMGESELREAWDWFKKGINLTVIGGSLVNSKWKVIYFTGKLNPPGLATLSEKTIILSYDLPTRAEAVLIAYRNRAMIPGEK